MKTRSVVKYRMETRSSYNNITEYQLHIFQLFYTDENNNVSKSIRMKIVYYQTFI